jgi:4a-hydroxytetrahydrobiopterin dehydratase
MERRLLSSGEIAAELKKLDGWQSDGGKLTRKYTFFNFAEALAFVNRVGEIAEAADHHPDITFGWGYANIETTTHDRDGVTDVDIALAEKISAIQ